MSALGFLALGSLGGARVLQVVPAEAFHQAVARQVLRAHAQQACCLRVAGRVNEASYVAPKLRAFLPALEAPALLASSPANALGEGRVAMRISGDRLHSAEFSEVSSVWVVTPS